MLYKEIKDSLLSKGWEFKYCETSGDLDMLIFSHKKISGNIVIDFDDYALPQNILDGDEFDYMTSEFLNVIPIKSITFEKDISISYLSDDIIDVYGSEDENIISFYKEDIDKHFHKVLSMLENPYCMLDFQQECNEKIIEFNSSIKKFFPILQKHGLETCEISCGYGNNAMFKKYAVIFNLDGSSYDGVNFYFDLFNSDKNSLYINICSEKFYSDIKIDPTEFEDVLIKQIEYYNKFQEKVKQNKKERKV